MKRKFNRDYSLSVVAPCAAILILLIAAGVLAQTPAAGQRFMQRTVVSAQEDPGAAARAASHSQTKRHRADAMDGSPLFAPPVAYDAGGYGGPVVVADVNGDGKPDVVLFNNNSNNITTLSVLLGNGDGTFQPAMTSIADIGSSEAPMAIADVNGDGKPDLVVGTIGGGVSVFLGNGDGTFQAAVSYPPDSGGLNTFSVAVADLNHDGHPDIVLGNGSGYSCAPGDLDVLLNNGDGTFQPAVAYSAGEGYCSVVVADVNGDGKPDLVGTNQGGMVAVLFGNGDGTFQSPVNYSTGGGEAGNLAVADVNGDGKLDLVVANSYTETRDGTVAVLLGNGDGTFHPAVSYDSGGWITYSGGLAIADVNGDGRPDIIVAHSDMSSMGVLLGNGDGTFQPATNYGSGEPAFLWSFAAADVNGDGRPDLVLANNCCETDGDGTVSVLLNNSGAPPSTTTLVSNVNPVNVKKAVTYTASVAIQSGGILSGTLTFQDGGGSIASVTLANNQASFSTSYTNKQLGLHTITATYGGELYVAMGSVSAPLLEYVRDLPTRTTVTTSGSPSHVGQPVTFTATVTCPKHTIPDGELVTFYDRSAEIGTGTTTGAVARFTTSSLTARTHIIKATYTGDGTFEPSTGLVKQVVEK